MSQQEIYIRHEPEEEPEEPFGIADYLGIFFITALCGAHNPIGGIIGFVIGVLAAYGDRKYRRMKRAFQRYQDKYGPKEEK